MAWAHQTGDPLSAVFSTDRYGTFEVSGTARVTLAGDLSVGDFILGGSLKAQTRRGETVDVRTPVASLRELPGTLGLGQGEAVDLADLVHGDLASVSFSHHLYGQFDITGIVTEGQDAVRMIANWIVSGEGKSWATAARLVSPAGEHSHRIPAIRGPLGADATEASIE